MLVWVVLFTEYVPSVIELAFQYFYFLFGAVRRNAYRGCRTEWMLPMTVQCPSTKYAFRHFINRFNYYHMTCGHGTPTCMLCPCYPVLSGFWIWKVASGFHYHFLLLFSSRKLCELCGNFPFLKKNFMVWYLNSGRKWAGKERTPQQILGGV